MAYLIQLLCSAQSSSALLQPLRQIPLSTGCWPLSYQSAMSSPERTQRLAVSYVCQVNSHLNAECQAVAPRLLAGTVGSAWRRGCGGAVGPAGPKMGRGGLTEPFWEKPSEG